MTTIDTTRLRKALPVMRWQPPVEHPLGCQRRGYLVDTFASTPGDWCRIIVTVWDIEADGVEWIHASLSYPQSEQMPTYDDLCLLHRACFPGYAYQVFAPPEKHINITANVLHLWGRVDGKPGLPDFGRFGTI